MTSGVQVYQGKYVYNMQNRILVKDEELSYDYVELVLQDSNLIAHRAEQWSFEIKTQWNEQKLECDLYIEEGNVLYISMLNIHHSPVSIAKVTQCRVSC